MTTQNVRNQASGEGNDARLTSDSNASPRRPPTPRRGPENVMNTLLSSAFPTFSRLSRQFFPPREFSPVGTAPTRTSDTKMSPPTIFRSSGENQNDIVYVVLALLAEHSCVARHLGAKVFDRTGYSLSVQVEGSPEDRARLAARWRELFPLESALFSHKTTYNPLAVDRLGTHFIEFTGIGPQEPLEVLRLITGTLSLPINVAYISLKREGGSYQSTVQLVIDAVSPERTRRALRIIRGWDTLPNRNVRILPLMPEVEPPTLARTNPRHPPALCASRMSRPASLHIALHRTSAIAASGGTGVSPVSSSGGAGWPSRPCAQSDSNNAIAPLAAPVKCPGDVDVV